MSRELTAACGSQGKLDVALMFACAFAQLGCPAILSIGEFAGPQHYRTECGPLPSITHANARRAAPSIPRTRPIAKRAEMRWSKLRY
jgi:hypothetical protein